MPWYVCFISVIYFVDACIEACALQIYLTRYTGVGYLCEQNIYNNYEISLSDNRVIYMEVHTILNIHIRIAIKILWIR